MSSVHRESLDPLLAARPGGPAEWCGNRLHDRSPWAAALIVAAVGWAALAALMIAIGVFVVEVLVPGSVGAWDGRVVNSFVNERTASLTDASAVGSGLADTVTVVAVGLVLTVVLLAKRAWPVLGLVVLALVTEITVYLAVTAVVTRQRPIVEQLERLRPGASFPSGHTAAAVALYFSIAAVVSVYASSRLIRGIAWAGLVLVPVVVALSRIYRGMHHPTDAAAGLVMGIGCVAVALLAVRTGVVVAGRRAGPVSEGVDAPSAAL